MIELTTTTKLIKGVLSCTDFSILEKLNTVFAENDMIDMNGVDFCKQLGVSRATFNSTLKLLQATNIITTSSMGVKGTRVKLVNREVLNELIKE